MNSYVHTRKELFMLSPILRYQARVGVEVGHPNSPISIKCSGQTAMWTFMAESIVYRLWVFSLFQQ